MKRILLALVVLAVTVSSVAQNRTTYSGIRNAVDYAYGMVPGSSALVVSAPAISTAGASTTYTVSMGMTTAGDGTPFAPLTIFSPVTIYDANGADTATPSAVSCSTPNIPDTCQFTATFTNAHGKGARIMSGTYGLVDAMAIQDTIGGSAILPGGGGRVAVDSKWALLGGTNATIAAAAVLPGIVIEDGRGPNLTFWQLGPTASTALAVPTTLTALTALPSATPVGAFGTGTYHMCISYVDFMGNEGACSADFSHAGLATGSFIFSAPTASAGAVGYTIYIGLTNGGNYTNLYHVPLSSSICTLTALETITPACAVANSTYGQAGSTATVTAITVNTAATAINNAVISASTLIHGNTIAKTTYGWTPGSKVALGGIQPVYWPATGAAATTTNPSILATLAVPPAFMNNVGRTIRLCGQATMSGASTATVLGVQFWWDADGSNTAGGLPVSIATTTLTPGSAVSGSVVNYNFCQTFTAQIVGAGATAGTIMPGPGYLAYSVTAPGTVAYTGPSVSTAAVGSLNLAASTGARIHVGVVHTTGTDGAATVLNNLTVEVL